MSSIPTSIPIPRNHHHHRHHHNNKNKQQILSAAYPAGAWWRRSTWTWWWACMCCYHQSRRLLTEWLRPHLRRGAAGGWCRPRCEYTRSSSGKERGNSCCCWWWCCSSSRNAATRDMRRPDISLKHTSIIFICVTVLEKTFLHIVSVQEAVLESKKQFCQIVLTIAYLGIFLTETNWQIYF